MPYSQPLGLIFVAIPKTGSTSVVEAVQRLHTPYGGKLQLFREKIDSVFLANQPLDGSDSELPGRAKHLSAAQIRQILGNTEFERCFKFSVVRNPWARTVSRYHFNHRDFELSEEQKQRRGTGRAFHDLPFDQWVERKWQRHRKGKTSGAQLDKLRDRDGRLLVDHVGRLDQVQLAMDTATDALGLPRTPVPHINGTVSLERGETTADNRTRKVEYMQYYTDETREMVAEMCREDIEYFGFRFGD